MNQPEDKLEIMYFCDWIEPTGKPCTQKIYINEETADRLYRTREDRHEGTVMMCSKHGEQWLKNNQAT